MAIDFSAGVPAVQLTNGQRTSMGLTPVGEDWEWGRFPGDSGTPETEYWAAFQGEVLCRALIISPCTYEERELEERTTDNRTKILPRSGRGKPKYISLRDLERRPLGMHLRFWGNQRQMFLEHIPSQRTYYDAALDRDGVPWDLSGFLDWAARWEAETTQTDREELSALLQSKKKKFAYQEGDFFRFPMGRREFGYGRILQDVRAWKKAEKPFWDALQGDRPLLVMPYRVLTRDPNLTPEELRKLPALPSFYMEDFPLAAGEYPIVGRLPLEEGEADHVIRYGKAVPWREAPAVIFQCGPVFQELEGAQPPPHCGRFQHWGVQGRMFTTRELLAQCVAQRSSGPYCREHWNDLRSRAFRPELEAVCAQLGLTVEDLPARLWD